MQAGSRAFINTIAQYTRTGINVFLSLFATRFILKALGENDYGTYSVVASVIAMLGFITSTLITTTQRHISFYIGKEDDEYVKKIFTNSLFLHLIIAVATCIILASLTNITITRWLVIDASRQHTAKIIFLLTILMLFCSIMSSPFKATFVARENIVSISIIEVLDCILKFALSICLLYINADKLLAYGIILALINVFSLAAFTFYGLYKYPECRLRIRKSDIDKDCIGLIFNFAGWTLYSTGCIIGRNQGMSVVLNRFFGTAINASYGIAMQVSGNIQFLAQAIMNALSPQIVKAESRNDRQKMLDLSSKSSKYAFLMLSMFSIPIIFEMPAILDIWLDTVPANAVVFCRFILLAAVCDQITIGLGSANQAIGRIASYSLIINTTKLATIIVAVWLLHTGRSILAVMYGYLIVECVCAAMRIPFLRLTAGLDIGRYLKDVILPIIPSTAILIIAGAGMTGFVDCPLRFIYTFIISVLADIATIWIFSLNKEEKNIVLGFIKSKTKN